MAGTDTSQLVNQDYAICIKPGESMCSIKYEVCSAGEFSLTNDATAGQRNVVDVYVSCFKALRWYSNIKNSKYFSCALNIQLGFQTKIS